MAFLQICLLAALSFAAQSLQASKDPLTDFCRRWGHATAQVDGKLYIDGGLVAWNPLSSNTLNYTNTWLLYSDLNSTTQDAGMPNQYANLTKNSTVPSVSGGILWADEINKCFYQYGGEYQGNPSDFTFWAYDTILNQWNETQYKSNVNSIQRVSFGAGAQIQELGLGFYYGGWINNHTTPGWNGPPMATSNLIRYDFTAGTLNNNTGPDSTGRAEGGMVYLPASDGGLLVYFGGVEDPYRNGSFVGANMSTIHIFDVSSSKWYTQAAGGNVPAMRRQFCAGVSWADDHSSYNIYLYGGFGIQNSTGFDDSYILSLPTFTWIKSFPTNNTSTPYGHGACSGDVINRDQMLIIGGWFPSTDACDAPSGWGQHNMNLGYNGPSNTLWDKYDPKVSTYFVPTPVIAVVGGGPTGGATATKPSNWDNGDLSVYFTRIPSFTSIRAATRTIPTGTLKPSSTASPDKLNVKAIAGGVVGGLAVLIAILSLMLFCLHRHKKARKNAAEKGTGPPPPVELAATSPIHEMSSPGSTKYMSMHSQPDMNGHPAFSGGASMHSRSVSNEHRTPTSPYPPQAYHSSSPTSPAPFPSPYASEPPHSNYQHNAYQSYSDNPSAYDPHNTPYDDPSAYPPPNAPHHQRQYSYPTPTSPNNPSFQHSPPQQHQQQVYYPPPPERSQASFSDRRSAEGTQYSGDTEHLPPSTSNTPAHFYAQPVPVHPPHAQQAGQGQGQGQGDGLRPYGDEGSNRGSVDSRRRPVRGRFVEVGNM
ncbi:hypothetical protein K505DRAFT_28250 [Melanomma pulvis-pyrius CBS 109.77]|uniref:Cell wall anchored protein n=1 Tax=Melanomma pulvis-pyrius CBS 109.77 TaxID=1314802 RepID=A0A6A6XDG4_9PLEO|nr:hypothetical protein K505DRAFT_28250 [Melanomma pulvis-pyrius CBS 109.77]